MSPPTERKGPVAGPHAASGPDREENDDAVGPVITFGLDSGDT